jgi:hypothetical protein
MAALQLFSHFDLISIILIPICFILNDLLNYIYIFNFILFLFIYVSDSVSIFLIVIYFVKDGFKN